MGNVSTFGVSADELGTKVADLMIEEERLRSEMIASLKADGGAGGDGTIRRKELATEIVRVRAKIRGISTSIEKHRAKLQEEEGLVVASIREENRRQQREGQSVTGFDHKLGADLVRARKNIQDFDEAFAGLRGSLAESSDRQQRQRQRQRQLQLPVRPSSESPTQQWDYSSVIPVQQHPWEVSKPVASTIPNQPQRKVPILTTYIETFKKALKADQEKEWESALRLYKEGILQTEEVLLADKNEKRKELANKALMQYTMRAFELQHYLTPETAFLDCIQEAIVRDNKGSHESALVFYRQGIRLTQDVLANAKVDEKTKQVTREKLSEWVRRAESLRAYLKKKDDLNKSSPE